MLEPPIESSKNWKKNWCLASLIEGDEEMMLGTLMGNCNCDILKVAWCFEWTKSERKAGPSIFSRE
jgi:hypothetical protein